MTLYRGSANLMTAFVLALCLSFVNSLSKQDANDKVAAVYSREHVATAPRNFRVEVLRTFPHEGQPFTQGLEVHSDGQQLIESSGAYPTGTESFIRIVDPATGKTLKKVSDGLENRFVEGIVQSDNGNWFASTYMNNRVMEYSPDMKLLREHVYPCTGWGLSRAHDGSVFFATNGTDHLITLDKSNFKVIDAKVVSCMGKRVEGVNELEMVENFMGMGPALLGNVYLSRLILALNPATAECIGAFHLESLPDYQTGESAGFHAANGIAYNKSSGSLFVTGKNWDQMFEVRLHEDPSSETIPKLSQLLQSRPPAPTALHVSSTGEVAPKDYKLSSVKPHLVRK